MTQFEKRNISMMMDLYEMTMANGYFKDYKEDEWVVFDVFYRKNPDEGGFAIFAGLEQVIDYLENMHFSNRLSRSAQIFLGRGDRVSEKDGSCRKGPYGRQ